MVNAVTGISAVSNIELALCLISCQDPMSRNNHVSPSRHDTVGKSNPLGANRAPNRTDNNFRNNTKVNIEKDCYLKTIEEIKQS